MKEPGRITRRRLAAVIGAAMGGRVGGAERPQAAGAGRAGRVRAAAERLRAKRPGKNISPAFRFLP